MFIVLCRCLCVLFSFLSAYTHSLFRSRSSLSLISFHCRRNLCLFSGYVFLFILHSIFCCLPTALCLSLSHSISCSVPSCLFILVAVVVSIISFFHFNITLGYWWMMVLFGCDFAHRMTRLCITRNGKKLGSKFFFAFSFSFSLLPSVIFSVVFVSS